MITFPILVGVLVLHRLSGDLFNQLKRFENRDRVLPAASEIVNFGDARALNKLIHEAGYIEGVDVVANLFALVTKNLIGLALEIALDQITEKTRWR